MAWHAGRGVGARRRGRPHHGARALVDAGAVHRLGRLLRLRARPLPAQPESAGVVCRRAWPPGQRGRGRRAGRRDRPARVLLDSVLEHERRRRAADGKGDRRPRGGRAVRLELHYPGADGRFGRTDIALVDPDNPLGLDRRDPAAKDDITTINVLNLPVGRPVIIQLSSKDVIHSLALPQMRVKQDEIPGIVQPVWFTPTQTGRWEIACSQLCGLAHYRMKAFYTIHTPEQFEAWLDEELAAQQPQ